jgi:hypothetical protein
VLSRHDIDAIIVENDSDAVIRTWQALSKDRQSTEQDQV